MSTLCPLFLFLAQVYFHCNIIMYLLKAFDHFYDLTIHFKNHADHMVNSDPWKFELRQNVSEHFWSNYHMDTLAVAVSNTSVIKPCSNIVLIHLTRKSYDVEESRETAAEYTASTSSYFPVFIPSSPSLPSSEMHFLVKPDDRIKCHYLLCDVGTYLGFSIQSHPHFCFP